MNTLLDRMGIELPQYPNRKHPYLGKITITPRPLWRSWLRFLPYFVGDTIRFRVQIETPQENPSVYERFGDGELESLSDFPGSVDSGDEEITGNPISREGGYEYRIGFYGSPNTSVTVITGKAINTDGWILGCGGFVLGIVGAIIGGIILGFIKIEPIIRMFINP